MSLRKIDVSYDSCCIILEIVRVTLGEFILYVPKKAVYRVGSEVIAVQCAAVKTHCEFSNIPLQKDVPILKNTCQPQSLRK